MFCPRCGSEILLNDTILKVEYGICEQCHHEFTVKNHGRVSDKELSRARRNFQKQYEDSVQGFERASVTLERIKQAK